MRQGVAIPAAHRVQAGPAPGEPVLLPGAQAFTLEPPGAPPYRLLVALPEAAPPPAGFPVLLMLDGDALFPAGLLAARLQAARPEVTGVAPAILVGIGYPGAAPFDAARRSADLLPEQGGADRFLDRIADVVLPFVETLAPVDRARLSLAGHSFGGLFALHALFTRPGLFARLVAGSPSIWWNERAILAARARFLAAPAPQRRPRLLLTVGGAEQDGEAGSDPRRAERLRMARMVDNAAEMAATLAASGHVACEHRVFPDENHISVLPAMMARTIAFALAEPAALSGARP